MEWLHNKQYISLIRGHKCKWIFFLFTWAHLLIYCIYKIYTVPKGWNIYIQVQSSKSYNRRCWGCLLTCHLFQHVCAVSQFTNRGWMTLLQHKLSSTHNTITLGMNHNSGCMQLNAKEQTTGKTKKTKHISVYSFKKLWIMRAVDMAKDENKRMTKSFCSRPFLKTTEVMWVSCNVWRQKMWTCTLCSCLSGLFPWINP